MPNLDREAAVKANNGFVLAWEAGQGLGVEQVLGAFKTSRKTVGDQEVYTMGFYSYICCAVSSAFRAIRNANSTSLLAGAVQHAFLVPQSCFKC